MRKKTFWGLLAIWGVLFYSCTEDNSVDGKVKRTFDSWAERNIEGNYNIDTISYDSAGTPCDYITLGAMMSQTVGTSGKSESEFNIAFNQIMLESYVDSTLFTKDIIVAKIKIKLNNKEKDYYIGMRDDSICTTPQEHAYKALYKTHHEGEQRMYDAVNEIFINLKTYADTQRNIKDNKQLTEEDFYSFWISLPRKKLRKEIGKN